jgi:arylsulfatase
LTHSALFWEFPGYGGQQAVINGDWKAIRVQMKTKGVKTELYNLANDPSETTDVAAANPEKVKELESLMAKEHTPSKEFPLPGVDK